MIALVIGCSSGEPPPVAGTDDDDPVLQAATAQARKTVGEFISRLEKPAAGEIFSVRAAFREGAVAEQLWLSEVRFDGKNFTGKVDDTPERLTAVKAGQTHQVSPEQISDWMILENNRLVSAYTIRAARPDPAESACQVGPRDGVLDRRGEVRARGHRFAPLEAIRFGPP